MLAPSLTSARLGDYCSTHLGGCPGAREYGHFPVVAQAPTLSPHALVVGQGHVDHAAVRRRHRLQGYAATGLRHSGCDFGGHVPERLLPTLAVMLHVQDHPDALSKFFTGDHVHHELKGLQSLAPPSNQEARVLSSQVNNWPTHFRVVGGPKSANHVHLGQ